MCHYSEKKSGALEFHFRDTSLHLVYTPRVAVGINVYVKRAHLFGLIISSLQSKAHKSIQV